MFSRSALCGQHRAAAAVVPARRRGVQPAALGVAGKAAWDVAAEMQACSGQGAGGRGQMSSARAGSLWGLPVLWAGRPFGGGGI